MPVIVIASPKGGAGKTTTALILATEFAHMGLDVSLLDCDATAEDTGLSVWADRTGDRMPPRLSLHQEVHERDVIRLINECDGDGKIVVVDLGGAASRMASRAISQADLVLVVLRPKPLDSALATAAIAMIYEEEEQLRRKIPFALAIGSGGMIKTKAHRAILDDAAKAGLDVIQPELGERAAYAQMFGPEGGGVRDVPRVGAHDAAIENAEAFARAVLARLMEPAA